METKVEVIKNDVDHIRTSIDVLFEKIETGLVKKEEFAPVKSVVYGLCAIILTAVAVAIVALVIIKN